MSGRLLNEGGCDMADGSTSTGISAQLFELIAELDWTEGIYRDELIRSVEPAPDHYAALMSLPSGGPYASPEAIVSALAVPERITSQTDPPGVRAASDSAAAPTPDRMAPPPPAASDAGVYVSFTKDPRRLPRLLLIVSVLGTVSGFNRWLLRRLVRVDVPWFGPARIKPVVLGVGLAVTVASAYISEEV